MSMRPTVNERLFLRQQATLYCIVLIDNCHVNRTMPTPAENEAPHSPQWTLIRDLAVLQVKLLVDGFRDLVLLPASIIAAIISLSRTKNGKPGPEFYKLLVAGKHSEHFINLFGALRNAPADIDPQDIGSGAEMDDLVSRVEIFVVDEYKRGGITAQAKSRIDEALEKIRKRKNTDADSADPTD
jgi:hypothetical protein